MPVRTRQVGFTTTTVRHTSKGRMAGDSSTTKSNPVVNFLVSLWKVLWEIWIEPFLQFIHVYEPADRTYGRSEVPFSKMEQRLHENPDVTVSFYKAMMPNGKDFVWYQVWEDKLAMRSTGRVADMVFCHGTGVHSGTLASHSRRYLDAGYRLIVPDLPSHGYSTGRHVYQPTMKGYTDGVYQAIHDVARRDDEAEGRKIPKQNRRRTFLLGLSFGGLVALLYPIYYPASARNDTTDMDEIPVDGVVAVGPILHFNPKDVKVSPVVRFIVTIIRFLNAGRLELYVPHKQAVDKDPKVYKQLVDQDMRSHRGAFRVGHLLCVRRGIADVQELADKFTVPVYIQHGLQDRVVSVTSSSTWLEKIGSDDIKMSVYPVCQHVIYRKAKTEEEDLAGRVCVLEDNVAWMNARCPGIGHIERGVSFSSDYSDMSKDASQRALAYSGFSSGLMTPSEAALSSMGQPNIVEDTIQSLTDKLGAFDQKGAKSTGVDNDASSTSQSLSNRLAKDSTKQPVTPVSGPDDSVEHRVYRGNWTLPEEMRPYDILID